jgi:hypothetical protein
MKTVQTILIAAIPGLMFCILPINGIDFRFSWQICTIWLAALAFVLWIPDNWHRLFSVFAFIQVIRDPLVLPGYITLFLIAIYITAVHGFREINENALFSAMICAASILFAWMILQKTGLLPGYIKVHTGCNRPGLPLHSGGPFNPDAAGIFFALCLPAFFQQNRRIFAIAPITGLFLAGTSTGFIAALAGTLIYILITPDKSQKTVAGYRPKCKTKRKILSSKTLSLLIAVLTAGFFFTVIDPLQNLLDCSRWQIWSRILHSFPGEPWGRGLGSFKQIFPLLYPESSMVHVTQAHNEYLQAGFEMGIFAMFLIFVYLFSGFYKVRKKRDHLTPNHCRAVAGFAILAISCAGFHVFHIPPLALLAAAWIGQFERFFSETESAFSPPNPAVFNKRILQPSKVAS